jgi:preprotein translocase SecE subunit
MASNRRKKPDTRIARELDPARWSYASFVVFGFIGAWVLTHLVEDTWAIVWEYWPQIARPSTLISNASGISLALLGLVMALRNKAWFRFINEVVVEVSQIRWPTKAEIRAGTSTVISLTLVCSLILTTIDSFWSLVTNQLYGL